MLAGQGQNSVAHDSERIIALFVYLFSLPLVAPRQRKEPPAPVNQKNTCGSCSRLDVCYTLHD